MWCIVFLFLHFAVLVSWVFLFLFSGVFVFGWTAVWNVVVLLLFFLQVLCRHIVFLFFCSIVLSRLWFVNSFTKSYRYYSCEIRSWIFFYYILLWMVLAILFVISIMRIVLNSIVKYFANLLQNRVICFSFYFFIKKKKMRFVLWNFFVILFGNLVCISF